MDKDLFFVQTMLSDQLVSSGFPLVYKGPLDHASMKFFTSMAKEEIANNCEDKGVQRKIFHVMVEMIQNITKHSANSDDKGVGGNGIFVVGGNEDYFYVITGNMIKNDKVRGLEETILSLNNMSKEELQTLYKSQIRGGELSKKGGAGLGLIDIVRKTDHGFGFQFLRIDTENQFFILKATIAKKTEEN
ncbi:MAG: SiaB family protein kinase, partial [Bacteroidales bacterium]|nr:SiaB family protein kinase [Bacteroidales bacterium]